jgi:maltose alpha-D-glucosyltransferase/alpha-amylase
VHIAGAAALPRQVAGKAFILVRLSVTLRNGETQMYFTPLVIEENRDDEQIPPYAVARVRRGSRMGLVLDADSDPAFGAALVQGMVEGREMPLGEGARLKFSGSEALHAEPPVTQADVRRLGGEQSNTSIAVAERMMLKIYRRLSPGVNPEVEIGRFLTNVAGFKNSPALLGAMERIDREGMPTALGILQRYVRNQGDAWGWTIEALKRGLETLSLPGAATERNPRDVFADYLPYAGMLGQRTGELHVALATPTDDPAFTTEALNEDDLRKRIETGRAEARRMLAQLERRQEGDPQIAALLGRRDELMRFYDALAQLTPLGVKTRIHGDYHLGQVLIVQDDVLIVDFEGEPSRSLDERRAKDLPLRDVAGMIRSFDYAAETAARDIEGRQVEAGGRVRAAALVWRDLVVETFLASYDRAVAGSPVEIADERARMRLLDLFLAQKAIYEIGYEASHRPSWIGIPIGGLISILDRTGEAP